MQKEKLTMITLFSGTGMQERGFQDSNLFDLDIIGTSEIDADASLSYAAVHCGLTPEMIKEYDFPDVEEMAQYLTDRKVGWDFQKDKGKDWFACKKGKKLEELKKYYLASVLQNNYGDISSIKELPYADFWTYSFPCTDISVAGKQEGLETTCNDCGHKFNPMKLEAEERHICPSCGSTNIKGTRSRLLAEVERLLTIAVENKTQPKYLLLENVKNLVGKSNKPDFDAWLHRLSDLGYNTHYAVLNAKFCGIPQNRERVFALSIRKDIDTGNFTFPQPFDNGLRLKDILEKEVDEKYYINTERAANLIEQLVEKGQLKGQRACADSTINDPNTREISNCITARYDASIQNQKQIGLVVCEPNGEQKRLGGLWDNETGKHQAGSVWDINGMSPTLDTAQGGGRMPHIIEDTAKPIYLGNTTPSGKSQRNAVYSTEGVSQTLCAGTHGYATGNILEETNKINVVGNYMSSNHDASRVVDTNGVAPCVQENHGTVTGILEEQPKLVKIKQATKQGYIECEVPGVADLSYPSSTTRRGRVQDNGQTCPTITATETGVHYIESLYRIRKLTPNECWLLMGLTKEDCMNAANLSISNSALYKIAGNGIVTDCIKLIAEHLYKAQYDNTYMCSDENFHNPQVD